MRLSIRRMVGNQGILIYGLNMFLHYITSARSMRLDETFHPTARHRDYPGLAQGVVSKNNVCPRIRQYIQKSHLSRCGLT